MDDRESNLGPIMPYGLAIREAQASGDAARIQQTADHAQRWLKDNPGHASFGEVQAALRELNESRGS